MSLIAGDGAGVVFMIYPATPSNSPDFYSSLTQIWSFLWHIISSLQNYEGFFQKNHLDWSIWGWFVHY